MAAYTLSAYAETLAASSIRWLNHGRARSARAGARRPARGARRRYRDRPAGLTRSTRWSRCAIAGPGLAGGDPQKPHIDRPPRRGTHFAAGETTIARGGGGRGGGGGKRGEGAGAVAGGGGWGPRRVSRRGGGQLAKLKGGAEGEGAVCHFCLKAPQLGGGGEKHHHPRAAGVRGEKMFQG